MGETDNMPGQNQCPYAEAQNTAIRELTVAIGQLRVDVERLSTQIAERDRASQFSTLTARWLVNLVIGLATFGGGLIAGHFMNRK